MRAQDISRRLVARARFTAMALLIAGTPWTLQADPPAPPVAAHVTPWAAARAAMRAEAAKPRPLMVTSEQGRQTHAQVAGAVEAALVWLVAHQSPDGRWEARDFAKWHQGAEVPFAERADGPGDAIYDVGVTGLALTALLVAGYWGGGEHAFDESARRGLAFLAASQDPEGCFGPRVVSTLKEVDRYELRGRGGRGWPPVLDEVPVASAGERKTYVYNHAAATIAMIEAAGLSNDSRWRKAAQHALNFIALARNPYGAWRYGVKPGDADTSVTGWMMLALHTARLVNRSAVAAGQAALFTIDEEAFEGIDAWIEKMTSEENGRVGHQVRGGAPSRLWGLQDRFPADMSESMSAVGVLARILGGQDRRKTQPLLAGADLCSKRPPKWDERDGSIDMVYWHFGTLALHQLGGCSKGATSAERRRCFAWLQEIERVLVEHQRAEGSFAGAKGSWDPVDPWGQAGGRVYSTAICALTLLTPVRLPLP